MQLSVVTTLYLSKPFLKRFITEVLDSIEKLKITNFEIIFVNDGSPDDSVAFLLEQKKEIKEIVIIDLSRNFGHHYAMQAGLSYAKGNHVFLIDNDLEIPPSFMMKGFEEMEKDATIDVVYGFQEKRGGKALWKYGGQFFYWLMNKISDSNIPKNILTERLMTKQFVQSLLELGDANLFLGGMMYWTGFNQKGIGLTKVPREGESTYKPFKSINLMIQAITSFTGKPLEYLFYFGLSITSSSFLYLIYIFIRKLLYNDQVVGWTSLIVINVLILGIISTFLGLIGMYIYKIFKQVQNRPNFIIKKIHE